MRNLIVTYFLVFVFLKVGDQQLTLEKVQKITIIDESYNSNPLSLKFTLEKYDSLYKNHNKKFLLLGDMLELGKHSKNLHYEIARYLNNSSINKIFVYGDHIKHTFNN